MTNQRASRPKRIIMWAIVIVAAVAYLNFWYFNTFFGVDGEHLRGSEFFRTLALDAFIPVASLIGVAILLDKLNQSSSTR